MNKFEISLVKTSEEIARFYHDGQKRWGGEPYIIHPMGVYENVKKTFPNRYALHCVAWLHDIIEDTAYSVKALNEEFPQEIVDGIIAITQNDNEDYDIYVQRAKKNKIARIVKVFDIQNNMEDLLLHRKKHKQRIKTYKMALLYLCE